MQRETPSHIKVIVRVRPLIASEKIRDENTSISFLGTKSIRASKGHNVLDLNFDRVFGPETKQAEVFQEIKGSIDAVLQGYNSTSFVYGMTSSGKTYTMLGDSKGKQEMDFTKVDENDIDGETFGVIPRAVQHIFDHIEKTRETSKYTLFCSYLEIYNEKVYDLLHPDRVSANYLDIHEDKQKGVVVPGLVEVQVTSMSDIFALMSVGTRQRAIAETLLNVHSSRSHTIFQLFIEHRNVKDNQNAWRAKLNLVDLSGTEKWKSSYMTSEHPRVQEMLSINQSLSTLGKCVSALLESNRTHIPFRDSKLTRLLQDSIGGDSITTFIITLSPSVLAFKESCSTLKFADRVKRVQLQSPKVHMIQSPEELSGEVQKLLAKYQGEIFRLRELLKNVGVELGESEIDESKSLGLFEKENHALKEEIKKLEQSLTREKESKANLTKILKGSMEKGGLVNDANVNDALSFRENGLKGVQRCVARLAEGINEVQHMETQMVSITTQCVSSLTSNLSHAIPRVIEQISYSLPQGENFNSELSEKVFRATTLVVKGCTKALEETLLKVNHQATQKTTQIFYSAITDLSLSSTPSNQHSNNTSENPQTENSNPPLSKNIPQTQTQSTQDTIHHTQQINASHSHTNPSSRPQTHTPKLIPSEKQPQRQISPQTRTLRSRSRSPSPLRKPPNNNNNNNNNTNNNHSPNISPRHSRSRSLSPQRNSIISQRSLSPQRNSTQIQNVYTPTLFPTPLSKKKNYFSTFIINPNSTISTIPTLRHSNNNINSNNNNNSNNTNNYNNYSYNSNLPPNTSYSKINPSIAIYRGAQSFSEK